MNQRYIINGKQRSVRGRGASPQLIHYTEQDGFCIHKKQYLDENGQINRIVLQLSHKPLNIVPCI
jgi:hypothetical protein